MDLRSIDPSECWIRHVRRGESSDASAFALGRVYFVRDDLVRGEDGLNGRQGWQQGETTAVLSDDGSFTLVLPNTAGDDGALHRRRFRVLTDPGYEPGEEWIEFWRDPNDLVFVGTPTDYEKSKSQVVIKGADLTAVLAGSISSDVDVWDGTAPADIIRHYSRIPVLAHGSEPAAAVPDNVGWGGTTYSQSVSGVATDCWTVEGRLRVTSPAASVIGTSGVRIDVAGISVQVDLFEGDTAVGGMWERTLVAKRQGLVIPGPVSIRIVARYERIFAFVTGELIGEFRRPTPFAAAPTVTFTAKNATAVLDALQVDTLADFAGRGASAVIERRLPGIPPATGLRGRYWNAAGVYAQRTTTAGRLPLLWPLAGEAEPAVDRVDPQLSFPAGTALYPPNLPGAYAARWTGAIYLDLAASDRKVRLSGLVGNARLYIGQTLRGAEAATSWASAAGTTPITSAPLRAHIGESTAGWYPIVVEHTHSAAAAGIVLEDVALDSAGNPAGGWATVPQSRLSPIGCYEDHVRLTPHRTVIADVAQAFGYQWRIEHRSTESGEFPGQISARVVIGRGTNVVIDDDAVGSDANVAGAATDVVDGMLVDAAGLADPNGASQLTAQVVDYARASDHLALRQAYESLSEISEAPLLQTRADSLLALRSSPNEQVGVRPSGQRDLVDTFPLTGSLARMDWQPGDGVLLDLDSIDVKDASPRQLTSVTWPHRRDGIGPPTVGFRQRPRTVRAAMRRFQAAIYGPRRTYQGSLALVSGSPGGATDTGGASPWAIDPYSRASLPGNLDGIVRAVVCVQHLSGTGWRLEVTAVDLGTPDGAVPSVGRYDVTRAVKATAVGNPMVYARLIGGSSGSYLLTLEITVRV